MPFRLSTRLPKFDDLGLYRYSVTIYVADRRPVFVTEPAVDLVRTQLEITADGNCVEITAYSFMPDHLHVLAQGVSDHARFLEFMRLFKHRSSYHWKRRHGHKLWQRRYIDRILRDREHTRTVARYILENPVRAGLVDSPEIYPFSGSFVMRMTELFDWVRRT